METATPDPRTKRPYTAPDVKIVALTNDEAVLAGCKGILVFSSYGGGGECGYWIGCLDVAS